MDTRGEVDGSLEYEDQATSQEMWHNSEVPERLKGLVFSISKEMTEEPELRICVPKIGIEDDSEVTMIREKLPSYLRKAMGQINKIVQLQSKGEVDEVKLIREVRSAFPWNMTTKRQAWKTPLKILQHLGLHTPVKKAVWRMSEVHNIFNIAI